MIARMLAYTVKLLTSKLKEELKMKKLLIFAALPLFIAAGCTTQYQAKAPYDDVYYSSRDIPAATSSKVVVKQVQAPSVSDYTSANNGENTQDASQQADNQTSGATEYLNYQEQPAGVMTESYVEPGGGSSVTNNFYGDYYDYAYASRLRRFHSNSYMDSYYDPYYSNMYYYDYNPWSWGTSIYFNSGWYSPSFGMSLGWGWPSYSYGGGYGSYMNGYNDGYNDGYWAGSGNYGGYYSDGGYNGNSHYYGHRGSSGYRGGSSNGRTSTASGGLTSDQRRNSMNDNSENNRGYGIGTGNGSGQRNNTTAVGNSARGVTPSSDSPSTINGRSQNNVSSQQQGRTTTPSQINDRNRQNTQPDRTNTPGSRGRYIAPAQNTPRNSNTRNFIPGRQVAPQPRIVNPQQPVVNPTNTNSRSQINTGRETPANNAQPARTYQQQGARIQSYSSPSYSKPRSSQEYTTPKYRNIRSNDNPSPSPQYSQPQQRTGSSVNTERRSTESPRQSTSAPVIERQQSTPAYSAPSRSSENSYSAPSRSGNSSNSSSSPSRSSSGSSESGRPRR